MGRCACGAPNREILAIRHLWRRFVDHFHSATYIFRQIINISAPLPPFWPIQSMKDQGMRPPDTCLQFQDQCDSPLDMIWHSKCSKCRRYFDKECYVLTCCCSFFFGLKLVLSLFMSPLVPMQVTTPKINSQCPCTIHLTSMNHLVSKKN